MTICEQISSDIKEAMKSKNIEKRDVLRSLDNMIKNEKIAQGKQKDDLGDDAVITLVKRAIKQRKDSAEQFKNGGRDDLAKKEEREINFIEKYLPKQMTKEEVRVIVKKIITDLNATNNGDMGRVMRDVMKAVGNATDGNTVRKIVEDILSE